MLKSRPMNNLSQLDSQPRSATDTSAITALCKAAGDPLRMQVLKVLQQNAYGVLELYLDATHCGDKKWLSPLGEWQPAPSLPRFLDDGSSLVGEYRTPDTAPIHHR